MPILHLVPHQQLARQWRQTALLSGRVLPVFSINGLVSHLLKEQGYPYRESIILEQTALWDTVWELNDQIEYYAPLVKYPGFIEDLHIFFTRFSLQTFGLEHLTEAEQHELSMLYQLYQKKLTGLHVLDTPAQIQKAMEYWPQSKLNREIERIEKYYLGDLTPLEQQFINVVSHGKQIENKQFRLEPADISGAIFSSPKEEIKYIALKIIELMNNGVDPEKIAVACPNFTGYLPTIVPIFSEYSIPWKAPALNLADTPMGKAFTVLAEVLQGNYTKQYLEQLIAVGWGLPVSWNQMERRALKLAPPSLRGFAAWEGELGHYPGWEQVFDFLRSLLLAKGTHPVNTYITCYQSVFAQFPLSLWPAKNQHEWAVLLKSYDGMQQIFNSLSQVKQRFTLAQFNQIFRTAMANHALPQPLTFQQTVTVSSLHQVIGMGYHTVFLVGMTESSFPAGHRRDWLSKQVLPDNSMEIYDQILRSADYIHLSFSESDQDGRVNIASPVFVQSPVSIEKQRTPLPAKSLIQFGSGIFNDETVIQDIINRFHNQQLSVSRLNLYARCPFSFLCSELFDLKAEEVTSEDITPQEEGALIHEVLRGFWELKGSTPILEILNHRYQAAGKQLTKRVVNMVSGFNKKDVKLVEKSEYVPRFLEYRFSDLDIPTATGSVLLRGIIDRIDVHPSGKGVIYDYKSGGNPTVREVLNGEDLQLYVYLLAADRLLPEQIQGIAYYNIKSGVRTGLWFEGEHRNLGLTKRSSGVMNADEWETLTQRFLQTIRNYLDKILSGYFPIAPVNDRVCTFCAYRGICRKEQ